MHTEEFHKLLHQTEALSAEQTEGLKSLVAQFPYFQAAQALYLKGLKQNHNFSYNAQLKKTAAHTTDRGILFEYITSDDFQQDAIAESMRSHQEPVIQEEPQKPKTKTETLPMDIDEANQVLDPALFETRKKPETDSATSNTPEKAIPETEEAPEEELALGKPLQFDRKEAHSFSEWLKLTKAKPIQRSENENKEPTPEEKSAEKNDTNTTAENATDEDQQRKFQLIEEFISKNPKIVPDKNASSSSKSLGQDAPSSQLMTETLARVYLEQKNYAKAIQAFKILILKNPEKSGFFADQIRAIEKLQENKNI